jgi:hypothetical protein
MHLSQSNGFPCRCEDCETERRALSGREYCPRCASGPRQAQDVKECPDCGREWAGPPLLMPIMMNAPAWCESCGSWRHMFPCGRDACPLGEGT